MFVDDVYREGDFVAGIRADRAGEPMLGQALAELDDLGFERFPQHHAVLTLYGPGDSHAWTPGPSRCSRRGTVGSRPGTAAHDSGRCPRRGRAADFVPHRVW